MRRTIHTLTGLCLSVLSILTTHIIGFTPLYSMAKTSMKGKQSPWTSLSAHDGTKSKNKKWIKPSDASKINNPDSLKSNIVSKAYHLYIDYFDKLWAETDVTRRQKVEKQKAIDAVLRVKTLMGNATDYFDVTENVKVQMTEACEVLLDELNAKDQRKLKLKVMGEVDISKPVAIYVKSAAVEGLEDDTELTKAPADLPPANTAVPQQQSNMFTTVPPSLKKKEVSKGRSVLFGATLGLIAAGWVYSGNYIFTTIFTLMVALGQLEYYRMVMNTGIYPARRISVCGACAMFVTALFAPHLHQMCLPFFSTFAMIWFLTKRSGGTSISEIATTFTGMFYLGYVPSYWVR